MARPVLFTFVSFELTYDELRSQISFFGKMVKLEFKRCTVEFLRSVRKISVRIFCFLTFYDFVHLID